MKKKSIASIRALTVSAMLTAMSVVIGIFCKTFLNFDNGLFRITFENLPIIIAGITLGPIAGGAVGCASDLVSYLLSAQTYPPNLIVTLGAFMIGVISGFMSKYVMKSKDNKGIIISATCAHMVGSMIIKPIGLYQFYGILVLFRIPLYCVIAPIEIFIICSIFKNSGIRKVFNKL